MTARLREKIIADAKTLAQIPKPNSDLHEILYEKAVYFGRKTLDIFEKNNPPLSDIESIIFEIGDLDFDHDDLDREYLIIVFRITSFRNLLYSYANNLMRDREANLGDYQANQTEIDELSAAVSRLHAYIQEEVKFEKAQSKLIKAAGQAQINLLFFSIPMQSIFDLVEAAKTELGKSKNANIRFVSSMLTNASTIAQNYWLNTRETLAKMPDRIKVFVRSIKKETTILASKATNFVLKSRIRRIRPRNDDFQKEFVVFQLVSKRDILIEYLIDFRIWDPKSTDKIFSSALFHLLMSHDYYPYSRNIVAEISRDLVTLQSEPKDVVRQYICSKAESVIEILGEAIRTTELSS